MIFSVVSVFLITTSGRVQAQLPTPLEEQGVSIELKQCAVKTLLFIIVYVILQFQLGAKQ